jgi:2-polyprenyl-3-methyl-5-hydroxy-6-metoxy-1,4-benzoquinol methylase
MLVSRESCPLCAISETKEVYTESFGSADLTEAVVSAYKERSHSEPQALSAYQYVLDYCSACDFVFQRNVPDDDFAATLYGQWINAATLFVNKVQKRPIDYYRSLSYTVFDLLSLTGKKPSELRVFDFGMGWGEFCLMCKAFGCDAFGSELAPEKVAHAKEAGIEHVDLGTIAPHSLDVINVNQVLEHLDRPRELLESLVGYLRPGGLLRVAVPNGDRLVRKLAGGGDVAKDVRRSLKLVAPLEHVNCFTHKALGRLLGELGLRPVQASRIRDVRHKSLANLKGIALEAVGLATPSSIELVYRAP